MTTDPINVGNPYGPTAAEMLGGETLTGEALLIYLSTRLSDLDEDIQALMGQAEEAIARKAYINEVKSWADKVVKAQENGDDELVHQLMNDFPQAPTGQRDLQVQLHESFHDMLPGGKGRTEDNLKKFTGHCDGLLDEINGQSELTMIRLQQLMSQRQVCVQMATNCMSTMDQGLKSITNNI
jgi:hypothetical protein